MDAKVAPVAEQRAHRIGQAANPHLQARAVIDHTRDDMGDGLFLGRGRRKGEIGQWRVAFDDHVDFRHVQQRIAQHARHVGIDLDDQSPRRAGDARRIVIGGAEGEPAMPVHRRHGDNERIGAHMIGEQPGRGAERGRHELDRAAALGLALADQRAFDRGQEHAVRPDAVEQLIAQHRLRGMDE